MALHILNVKIGYIFMLGKHGRISAVVAAGGRRIDECCFTSVGLVENSCNRFPGVFSYSIYQVITHLSNSYSSCASFFILTAG